MSRWAEQTFAYHRTGPASNGRVENTHMLAEKIRRNAHRFTNHRNGRRRLIGRAVSPGILDPPHEYEAANHDSSREPRNPLVTAGFSREMRQRLPREGSVPMPFAITRSITSSAPPAIDCILISRK